MHSASLKRSATRRAPTPRSGEAEPLGEPRSASSSGIAPNPSCPVRRWHAGREPADGNGINRRATELTPPPDTEVPGFRVRLGQPPTAFGPRVRQHRGGGQVLDPPGPGKLVDVGGDAVQDRRHSRQVDHYQRPPGQPAGALPKPAHLIEQAVADQVTPVQLGIVIPVGVFRAGQPTARSSSSAASSPSRSVPAVIWCARVGESHASAAM